MIRAIVGGVFVLCCALPVGWMLWALASQPHAFAAIYPIGFHLKLLGRTLAYNGLVAVLATLLALPVAVVLGKGRGWVAGVLAFVLPAALLLPSIVYSYGWMQVLRVANEFVRGRGWVEWLGIESVYPMPGSAGDVGRCVWTLATWLWPIPAGVIGLSLRQVDADLQQQALIEGAYWRVIGRQLVGPALAGLAVVAILAMQEFAVYEPTGISVVATEVRTVFETGEPGWTTGSISSVKSGQAFSLEPSEQERNAASALVTALPMLAVIGLLSFVALRVGRDDASDVVDIGTKPAVLAPGWGSVILALGVIGVILVLPMVTMILSIRREFDLDRIWRTFAPPVLGTLTVAVLAGGVAVGVAACGLVRRLTWPAVLGLVTFLIGGQLLAIALIRLYNHPRFELGYRWVYNGPGIVVMAYLARFGWLAAWATRSTWTSRWRSLRDMSAVDGAGAVAAARHVVWPIAWPLVAACGVLVMLLSMTEVPATVLLNPLRPQVFVPQLMTWVHTLRNDDMLEGSLLLAGMVVLLASVVVVGVLVTRKRALMVTSKPRMYVRGSAAVLLVAISLLLIGCSKGEKPDAVWLETGAGEGQVVYPRAICYSKTDDSYYVVDRLARIQHIDHAGKFVSGWRLKEFSQGKPVGLTVGPDGNLWVPDTHYSRVLVFDPKNGQLVKKFGEHGRGPGQFIFPSDIAFDSKGRVFVSEFGDNDRIQVFDHDLKLLYAFGRFGAGDGEFSRPQSMVIDGETLYVTDACNHRIQVFTTDGRFVRTIGKIGSGLGEFRFPYGLDMDSKGRLVVCEFGNNRVQLVDKQTGKGLAAWGTGGRDLGQLAYPWGVAVDKDDRVVAVDAGNNRLQVFGF